MIMIALREIGAFLTYMTVLTIVMAGMVVWFLFLLWAGMSIWQGEML